VTNVEEETKMTEGKPPQGRLGIYLPEPTIKRLKMLGVESDKPVNTLISEALSFWWKAQHETSRGPLFQDETATSTQTTTPKRYSTKISKKEARKG
jgi:hypothetical protein